MHVTLQQENTDTDEEEKIGERLQAFGSGLQELLDEQIRLKSPVERRWLNDMRQLHGKYSVEDEAKLNAATNTSKLFVNITRNKTNGGESRWGEMLFPTDDRNFGLGPTPVPSLMLKLESQQPVVDARDGMETTEGDLAKEELTEARKRARAMEEEIADQLVEARYNIKARDAIHDACSLGSGIFKGPIIVNRTRRGWQKGQDNVYTMDVMEDYRPGVKVVSPWDFFPDMSARNINEADFTFERSYLTRRQLRMLKNAKGYIKSQLAIALRTDPAESHHSKHILQEMRSIAELDSVRDDKRFEVWEYQGSIDKENLIAAGVEVDEDDPCEAYDGVVVFVNGIVIKASVNISEDQDSMYCVLNWEKDETNIFGYGIPYLMRSAQRVINGAWRMMMDNAGLSVGPQIIINRELVEPGDGVWGITARKLWYSKDKRGDVRGAMAAFEVPSHQAELANIFEMARQLADEETNLPLIAQGEQASHVTKTAGGMNMLMNSANIVLRKAVKNFDDDVTTPLITRFYNWNMQFNDKEEIKGDFEVDARGSSALLAKEMQAQNMQAVMNIAQSPAFAPMTKFAGLYRKALQTMQISVDDVIKSDEEIRQAEEQAAQQQDPALVLKERELELGQLKVEMLGQIAQMKTQMAEQVALINAAAQERISMEQLRGSLGIDQQKIDDKRDIEGVKALNQQNEMAIKLKTGSGI